MKVDEKAYQSALRANRRKTFSAEGGADECFRYFVSCYEAAKSADQRDDTTDWKAVAERAISDFNHCWAEMKEAKELLKRESSTLDEAGKLFVAELMTNAIMKEAFAIGGDTDQGVMGPRTSWQGGTRCLAGALRDQEAGMIVFTDTRWLYIALHKRMVAGCGCCWQRPSLRCPASLLVKFGRNWLEVSFPRWRKSNRLEGHSS